MSTTTNMHNSFIKDTLIYAKRFKMFQSEDWRVYFAWVGLMMGLLFSVCGFMAVGWYNNVQFPSYAWNVPIGTIIFIGAIAFDTIGHRSLYKEVLRKGEALVHHITIFAGVTSCIMLCLAYSHPDFFRIPAWSFTLLTFFYSAIDEWMHWKRFMEGRSDRVEMWSHFFIFVGHTIMMGGWLYWFESGYSGVAETLVHLKL